MRSAMTKLVANEAYRPALAGAYHFFEVMLPGFAVLLLYRRLVGLRRLERRGSEIAVALPGAAVDAFAAASPRTARVGRNDRRPCDSGGKHKHYCGATAS